MSFVGVSKRYGSVPAVRDLDLLCPAGEMLALLGPSGCGKTTTLKMAAGLEEVSTGEIFFGDRPVSRLAPGARNVAMVFEDYALYPNLSVEANIAFPLKARGVPKATAARRVTEVIDLLGLDDVATSDVRRLSGGAQQRVSIGRALVRDPALILFDEPLSHLDGDQKVQLRVEIKRLQALRGVTSILVTHDQTEAMAMADHVAIMNDGVLQQVGAPQALYEAPANLFVANFVGEPPMNLLAGETDESGRLVLGGFALALDDRQRALARAARTPHLVAGLRPEHVVVGPPSAGKVDGHIAYREPRGDRDILTIGLAADARLVAEVVGPSPWRAGDPVGIELPARHLHLFDAATGVRLRGTA